MQGLWVLWGGDAIIGALPKGFRDFGPYECAGPSSNYRVRFRGPLRAPLRLHRDAVVGSSARVQGLWAINRVKFYRVHGVWGVYRIPVRPSPPPPPPNGSSPPPPLWCGVVVGCFPPPLWCGVVWLWVASPLLVGWCGSGVGFGGSPPSPPVAWCGLGLHVWICLGCLANPCS